MFAEWSDPNDINNYYEDVKNIFTKVADYTNPASLSAPPVPTLPTPIAPSPAASPLVANQLPSAQAPLVAGQVSTTPQSATVVNQLPPGTVSKFTVTPNTIFTDGYPVGSQPEYNILRSGPPEKKESYRNKHCKLMHETDSNSYVLIIIIFIMFVYILYLHFKLSSACMYAKGFHMISDVLEKLYKNENKRH